MNYSFRIIPALIILSLCHTFIYGQEPLKVELTIGGSYGRTTPKTTATSGLYTQELRKQAGKILGTNVGLNVSIHKVKIGIELENRFQNWIFDSYASIKNIHLYMGLAVMKRSRSSLYLLLGTGYFYKRYYHAISSGMIYRSYNDSILFSTQSIYKTENNSRFNIMTGLQFAWNASKVSSLHLSLRYTRGLEPFLFMDLEAEHVQLGPGSSKAQYDGSALLFSVSYGLNLTGLRKRLKNAMQ